MTELESALKRLETADSAEGRRIVAALPDRAGLNEALVSRTLALFGSRAAAAARLSRHWPVALKLGDDPALAMRLRGIHERLAGRWRESAKAFIRAGELANDPVSALSYQLGAIDAFARAGDVRRAVALGDGLAKQFSKMNRPDQAGRALLNTGNALMWADRNAEARDRLRRAQPLLEEADLAGEQISVHLGLSSAALYLGRLSECESEAREAERKAEAAGQDYVAALARVNLAHAFMQCGRPDAAVDLLTVLRDDFADSPIDLCRIWEFLGDSLFRLNLWTDAAEAYQQALRLRRHSTPANAANCRLGLALCAQADGQPAEKLFRAARSAFARIQAPAWEAAALAGLARELPTKRGLPLALRASALARKSQAPHHEAWALLCAADLGGAASLLNRAATLVDRHQLLGLVWRVHFAKAQRFSRPLPSYRRMLEAIVSARVLQTSMAARTGFLKDKEAAIRAYLGHLLSQPRPARLREAVDVVAQIRSASLVDEIFAAAADLLAPEEHSRLQALRLELAGAAAEIPLDSDRPTRRAAAPHQATSADLRVAAGRVFQAPPHPNVAVFVELESGAALLQKEASHRLSFNPELLQDSLRWLKFELLAPMTDRGADPDSALCLLHDLARQFGVPQAEGICPDGVMFSLPWATLAMLAHQPEPVIALHPAFTGAGNSALDPRSRAVLWWDDKADLPYAAREADAFLTAFPHAELCRTAAEARRSMETPIQVLHVLGHADHNPRNPMYSRLKFADDEIAAREISASPLRVAFANIAACSSGALSTVMRHEPDGLVRSFLARGAKTVIGSAWPLDDEAGWLLNQDFYLNLAAGATIRASLREARTALRGKLPHPYFWGCSTLFGGYLA